MWHFSPITARAQLLSHFDFSTSGGSHHYFLSRYAHISKTEIGTGSTIETQRGIDIVGSPKPYILHMVQSGSNVQVTLGSPPI